MTALTDDPEEFVTIREFFDTGEASLAKGALESAGFECLMVNENASRMYGGVLAVQLQVHRKDEADALEVLDSAGEDDADERVDDDE